MEKEKKVFYGWWIVLVAFLSIAVTYGTKGAFGIVQMKMLEDLNWSRASVAGALAANMLVYALAAPFVGRIMDKVGLKKIMILGALGTGAAFMLSATITSTWQFILYYGILLGLANTGMGMIPGPTAVNRWFVKKRGRALSIALVASPLGMAIFTFLAKDLLNQIGWQGMFILMGASAWLLVIIPAWLIMRSSPEEMGLKPDGLTESSDSPAANQLPLTDEKVWTVMDVIKSPMAWCIFLGYGLVAGNGWAQQVHQVPHLIQLGLTKDQASSALGFNMLFAVISTLIWPTLSDYMKRSSAVIISMIIQAIGTILLLNAHNLTMTYAFVIVMGLTYFGSYGLFSAFAADYFGRKSLGMISGMMAMIAAGSSALGIYAGGLLYDLSGNYNLLWQIGFIGLIITAIMTFALTRKNVQTSPSVQTKI